MKTVDLNVDIGEGFFDDDYLLDFATSASICLGVHAGSWELTETTVVMCRRRGIRIGAHPGYPDRAHMGRRSSQDSGGQQMEWIQAAIDSVERFRTLCKPAYIKPHGALYHDSAILGRPMGGVVGTKKLEGPMLSVAAHAVRAMLHPFTPLMGLPGTAHERIVEQAFLSTSPSMFIREGFADRRYLPNGLLAPRSEPGAILEDPDEIRLQVLAIAPKVDSICLHGDTPNCLEFAELVKKTLRDAGYEVGY